MNTSAPDAEITPQSLRTSLSSFWSAVCDIRCKDGWIAIALPLLLPDGWQVEVFVQQYSARGIHITDHGRVWNILESAGLNTDKKSNWSWLNELCRQYGVSFEEEGAYINARTDESARHIHLFGLFIAAVAQRAEVMSKRAPSVRPLCATLALRQSFHRLGINPIQKVQYPVAGDAITVENTLQGSRHTLLIQPVERLKEGKELLELWAYRLREIRETNPVKYRTGIVYSEEAITAPPSIMNRLAPSCDFIISSLYPEVIDKSIREYTG